MNLFSSLRIGTRLAVGFAIVLLLSIISTSYSLVTARSAADATKRMTELPLVKERLVADWFVLTTSAIVRTSMIAKSTDDTLATVFAAPIVDSVARVNDIMSEITSASQEQRTGIDQVNEAITQMDHVTQQNAALVEEAAAAAASLKEQAEALANVAAGFKLATGAPAGRQRPAVAVNQARLRVT